MTQTGEWLSASVVVLVALLVVMNVAVDLLLYVARAEIGPEARALFARPAGRVRRARGPAPRRHPPAEPQPG